MISKTFYNRKIDFIEPENISKKYWDKSSESDKKINSNLIKKGSISRNIMVGNQQDASILSNIDLRITGFINDNLKIQAVISDNNLPFQEDGNSYQIQEFDKVFIKIYNEKNEIITGDIFTKNNSRFLKFNKKSKGVAYKSEKKIGKFNHINTTSISMSKGKYTTNSFMGIEGNQGPYKLNGRQGENYIVILAGTEKVFMDGELLIRGVEKDYIINYNTSEITFTNKKFITKDKRIYVEFEYNNRSYAQSTISSHQNIVNKKINLTFDFFSEKDWKNYNYLSDISENDKKNLSNIGDSENEILVSSVDSVPFNNQKNLYKKMDTLIEGINISYYRFSINPDSAFYQISFTKVNQNEGNYIIKEEGENGRIFIWVPPVLSLDILKSQGNYIPNIRLITPKSKTIISANLKYYISEKISITTNLTIENNDKNLFSKLNDNDNNSFATCLNFSYNIIDNSIWKIKTMNSIEIIQKRYNGVNRYREVEFDRKWNINNVIGDQYLQSNDVVLNYKESDLINYNFQTLRIGTEYSANKHSTKLNYLKKNFKIISKTNYSNIKSNIYNSKMIFSKSTLLKEFKYFTLKSRLHSEMIRNFSIEDISLATSNSFQDIMGGISNKSDFLSLEILKRKEKKISNCKFNDFSKSLQINSLMKIKQNKNIQIISNISFRKLEYNNDSLTNEQNLLSSNNLNGSILNDFIIFKSTYEIGKGKESKKIQNFIKVPLGMGTHNWIDENNNNIEELSEFVIALFADQAEYVSLILPSDQLEDMYTLNFNQSIHLNLNKISNNKFLKKIKWTNLYTINNKNKNFLTNPFYNNLIDSSINLLFQTTNHITFNRSHPALNFIISNKNSVTKNSFSYGEEKVIISEKILGNNIVIFKVLKNKIIFTIGEKESFSEFFNIKNYKYSYKRIEENIKIENIRKDIFTIYYKFEQKQTNNNETKLNSNKIGFEYLTTITENNQFIRDIKYVKIQFKSSENLILNYELMEGLNNGNNFVWNLKWKKDLKKNLNLTLQYSGRKSGGNNTKHIGNAGITAYF